MSNADQDANIFDDAMELPTDLLAAWHGQVRSLADSAPVEVEDNAGSMLAQLRVVADDLARPARSARTRLLTTGDHELPIGVFGDALAETETFDSDVEAPLSSAFDIAAVKQSIEESERRIEMALVASHERLTSVFNQALRSVAGTPDGPRELELAEARTQLADVRDELAHARARMEAEEGAALQRAIGMLSVLESLDDVVDALSGQADDPTADRICQFEREARAMARLVELDEIATEGAVDPDFHEIVSTVGGTTRAGAIVEVRQRGYTFRGRIVRRAQVVVSARGRG
jgi:molecular chaperone GrpE (heat shock protein)